MDSSKININQIKYYHSNLSYHGKKLLINLPETNCLNGIEEYFNKYQIRIEILDENIYNFFKQLEENNQKHFYKKIDKYKSNLLKENNKYYLLLKLPYRYKKFEVNVKSSTKYLPSIYDVNKDTRIKCTILISKLWNVQTDNNDILGGCLMDVKEIEIM